jgi:threonine dehydrogenase-like Zn-dependent dehydrogenase
LAAVVTADGPEVPDECAALVAESPGTTVYRTVPTAGDLGEGGLGRVLAAGVCGSDLALLRGGPISDRLWPFILGHETVVRIDRCSSVLTERWGVTTGDRVFVEEFIPCGWCEVCRSGRSRVCPRTDFRSADFLRYGRTSLTTTPGLWGGFAEYLYLHPDARLHRLPASLDAHLGALATPVANGLFWLRSTADLRPGESVVVLGPGAHGLGGVAAARLLGAAEVIVVGRSTDAIRLSTATALGATATACSDVDDIETEVRRHTGGQGADVVIDATGSASVAALSVRLAAPNGRVVLAGGLTEQADSFPVDLISRRELSILGVRGHRGQDIAEAIRVLADSAVDFSPMAANPTPLEDGAALLSRLCEPGWRDEPAHHVLVPDPW